MGEYTKKASKSYHVCHHVRREQRRLEAAERDTARGKRSYEEQLALLKTRPGDSLREKARLA